MAYRKEYVTIKRAAREIWHTALLSNRYLRDLSEEDLSVLQSKGSLQIFVNSERDDLMIADAKTLSSLPKHIAKPGKEPDINDFENGYYFRAEQWKAEGGGVIVVLYYHH